MNISNVNHDAPDQGDQNALIDDLTPAIWVACERCGAPAVDYRLCGPCANSLTENDDAEWVYLGPTVEGRDE